MMHDLHTLLAKVQISGPFVLVGQSFGGMNMGLYARRYPAEAAGLMMVDAVHEAITSCSNMAVRGVQGPAQKARWPAWQQELASRSPHSELILAERSAHNIHQDQPDVVVAAVQELVDQTR
jgi:pimeloyl-ACP methyl ester carboxylesterase